MNIFRVLQNNDTEKDWVSDPPQLYRNLTFNIFVYIAVLQVMAVRRAADMKINKTPSVYTTGLY